MRPLAVLLLAALPLFGCAATVAIGKDSLAVLRAPVACPPAAPSQVVGTRTTTTEKLDDKIGFKPQIEERTTVTEPALVPAPEGQVSVSESRGATISAAGGNFLLRALKFVGCVGTLGAFCLP